MSKTVDEREILPRLRFTVPGTPVAQGRGRATVVGGHARVYDPKKSRNYKATVQAHAQHECAVHPAFGRATAEPVEVTIRAFWECPRSKWRKTNPRGAERRAKKPDGDNVAKAICDAMNGVVFLDDSQVVRLVVEKWQAAQGDPARVEIEVVEVEGP